MPNIAGHWVPDAPSPYGTLAQWPFPGSAARADRFTRFDWDRCSAPKAEAPRGCFGRVRFGGSSSGRTADSDSVNRGSNPRPPAIHPDRFSLILRPTAADVGAASVCRYDPQPPEFRSGLSGTGSVRRRRRGGGVWLNPKRGDNGNKILFGGVTAHAIDHPFVSIVIWRQCF